jgi:hypothetical protein
MIWLCERLTKRPLATMVDHPVAARDRAYATALGSPVSLSAGHKDSDTCGHFPTTSPRVGENGVHSCSCGPVAQSSSLEGRRGNGGMAMSS